MRYVLICTLLLACAEQAPSEDADTGTESPRMATDGSALPPVVGDDAASMDADPTPQDAASAEDARLPDEPEADAASNEADAAPMVEPVDCSPLTANAHLLCRSTPDSCHVVFDGGQGCTAVCALAGLSCAQSFEDVEDLCAADRMRPALECDSGHRSDYCVCVRPCRDDGCCVEAGCGQLEPDDPDRPIAEERLCTDELCPAFPGAEGEGMLARGGRGGDVYHVTSLADSGAGSLRDGLAGEGARTIVFDVAGIIDLRSPLRSTRNNLTIAGQTAPGGGITTRGYQVDLRGNNLILQHLRFRAGDIRKKTQNREGFTEDSLTIQGSNSIVDHVSASWGIDENLSSASSDWTNITIQHSIISEGLMRSRLFHGEYDADHAGHSMGGLYKSRGDSEISIHHNLFAHNNNRNPGIGNYERDESQKADIRNNVIYNCNNMGYVSGESGRVDVNYVGNYAIWGEEEDNTMFDGNEDANVHLYQRGNKMDTDRDGRRDGQDRGWAMFGNDYDREDEAVEMRPVTTHSADDAYALVLDQAGARPWSRDSVDRRVVEDVRDETGSIIDSPSDVGGYDDRSGGRIVDGDRDGMPDAWEAAYGTDPQLRDHNGDLDGDGYTNLEAYLHHASANGPSEG